MSGPESVFILGFMDANSKSNMSRMEFNEFLKNCIYKLASYRDLSSRGFIRLVDVTKDNVY